MKKIVASLVFMLGCLLASYPYAWAEMDKVLYEGDSLYHHIHVSEADGYRLSKNGFNLTFS